MKDNNDITENDGGGKDVEEKEDGGCHRGYHFISLRSHCCDSSPVHGPEAGKGKDNGHHLHVLYTDVIIYMCWTQRLAFTV